MQLETASSNVTPPIADLETKVLAICRRLLRNQDFGVTDNFFDAGGHSLLAMTLMLEIETQVDSKIGLETIFSSPTVRAICAAMGGPQEREPVAIFPVKSDLSLKTLYLAHSAFELSALSAALPRGVSIDCATINDTEWLRGLMNGSDVLGAIDQISEAYAQAISARRNNEPFYLAGYSFAGVLAIETACKLERRGVAPETIFVFDTYLHGPIHRLAYDILHDRWLTRKLQQALGGDMRELSRRATLPIRNAWTRWRRPAVAEKFGMQPPSELASLFGELSERATRAYRGPQSPPKTRTVLFRATTSLGGKTEQGNPDLGWARQLEPNLTVLPAPGDHFELIKGDNARYLAGEMARLMALPPGT